MSVDNFYNHPTSSHVEATPVSAATQQQAQQTHANAQKAADKQADDKAARLFPTMPQGEKPAVEPAKIEPDKAAALYDVSAIYADSVLLKDAPNATPEQIAEANSSHRAELAKLELSGVDARQFTDTFNTAMRTQISDDEYEARAANLKTEVERTLGAGTYEERLADVKKLLARADPSVHEALRQSGMAVDPAVFVALANHARSLKGRGRL